MNLVGGLVRPVDDLAQRIEWVALPSVSKKFADDQAGGNLAALLLAYYAFLSVFRLLLVFTTVAVNVWNSV